MRRVFFDLFSFISSIFESLTKKFRVSQKSYRNASTSSADVLRSSSLKYAAVCITCLCRNFKSNFFNPMFCSLCFHIHGTIKKRAISDSPCVSIESPPPRSNGLFVVMYSEDKVKTSVKSKLEEMDDKEKNSLDALGISSEKSEASWDRIEMRQKNVLFSH